MTRPNVLVGALAAVCVGTLLWCAWLIVAVDLTVGTSIAAWGLWLLVAAASTTLVAYVRELGRHRHSVTSGGSWKPLPSLVLVWIGGLTAVGVFAFMMPSGAGQGAAADSPRADSPVSKASATIQAPTKTTRAGVRAGSTTASRSTERTSPMTSPTAATTSAPSSTTTSHPGVTTTLPRPS